MPGRIASPVAGAGASINDGRGNDMKIAMKRILSVLLVCSALFATLWANAQTAPVATFRGGPVLSAPRIFLLFWGPSFNRTERDDAINYAKGYVQYLSNGASPNGKEPTARQYGIWGAYYAGAVWD